VALVVIGVVAAVLRPWAGDDDPRADPPRTRSFTATTADTGEVGGVSTTRSDPTPPEEPTPVEVRVHDTCGDGSCYLQVRTGPSTDDAEARDAQGRSERWDDQSVHEVVCWEHGEKVSSQSLGRSSDRWARTTDGDWVALLHLDGTVPAC
jgi:serine/threonine-protein kinase